MKKTAAMVVILFAFFAAAPSLAELSRMMFLGAGLVDEFENGLGLPNQPLDHGKGSVQMKRRKALMVEVQDYEETGPNSKHDPNPKKKPSRNGKA